jgi:hypothetical protein
VTLCAVHGALTGGKDSVNRRDFQTVSGAARRMAPCGLRRPIVRGPTVPARGIACTARDFARLVSQLTRGLATMRLVQCSLCFGRGYRPEKRKPSKKNPAGLGFYARTCRKCRGSGAVNANERRR